MRVRAATRRAPRWSRLRRRGAANAAPLSSRSAAAAARTAAERMSRAGAQRCEQLLVVRQEVGEEAPRCEHQLGDVARAERVQNSGPVAARDDDPRAAEHGELLREIRGLDLDLRAQLVYRARP